MRTARPTSTATATRPRGASSRRSRTRSPATMTSSSTRTRTSTTSEPRPRSAARAGTRSTSGPGHIVALNSELKDGTRATPWAQRSYQVQGPGTEQYEWLKADLAAHPNRCVAAMVHRPRYTTSAIHDDSLAIAPLYQLLYDADADLLLAGPPHAYERYPELGPDEDLQPGRGLREFVVGTGGAKLQPLDPPAHHVEVRNVGSYGLLRLTLRPDGYDWRFLTAAGSTFTDEGSTACH